MVCNEVSLALSIAMSASVSAPTPAVSALLNEEAKACMPVMWSVAVPRFELIVPSLVIAAVMLAIAALASVCCTPCTPFELVTVLVVVLVVEEVELDDDVEDEVVVGGTPVVL